MKYTESELNRLSRKDLLDVIAGINEVFIGEGIDPRGKHHALLVEDILEFQEEKGVFPSGREKA
jgi:hypothetical protein